MPEEVALKYGYRADQRVVNFVLRRRFNAYTAEVEGGIATAGGRESYGAELNYLQINRAGRINLGAEFRRAEPLFESERDIIQAEPVAGIELGRYRTLLPRTDQLELSGTINRAVSETVSATLNATLDVDSSTAFLGLPRPSLTPPGLRRESDTRSGHIGLSVNGAIQPWQWTLTGNLDRNASESETQTNIGTDRSRSVSQIGNAELLMNGPLFNLPGGGVTAAARAGFDARGLTSQSLRGGIFTVRELSRTREHAQVNIDIPIASRRRAVLTRSGQPLRQPQRRGRASLRFRDPAHSGRRAQLVAHLRGEPDRLGHRRGRRALDAAARRPGAADARASGCSTSSAARRSR